MRKQAQRENFRTSLEAQGRGANTAIPLLQGPPPPAWPSSQLPTVHPDPLFSHTPLTTPRPQLWALVSVEGLIVASLHQSPDLELASLEISVPFPMSWVPRMPLGCDPIPMQGHIPLVTIIWLGFIEGLGGLTLTLTLGFLSSLSPRLFQSQDD